MRKNYYLKFSLNVRIYLIFHISLLKLANLEILLQKTFYFQPNKGQIYFIKKIINY